VSLEERILNPGEFEIVWRGDIITYKRENLIVDIVLYNKGLNVIINLQAGQPNYPDNLPWITVINGTGGMAALLYQ